MKNLDTVKERYKRKAYKTNNRNTVYEIRQEDLAPAVPKQALGSSNFLKNRYQMRCSGKNVKET
jgi:hypothetical protein